MLRSGTTLSRVSTDSGLTEPYVPYDDYATTSYGRVSTGLDLPPPVDAASGRPACYTYNTVTNGATASNTTSNADADADADGAAASTTADNAASAPAQDAM